MRTAEEAEGLLRRPAQRMEDLARIGHLLEPGASFRRALDRQEQREEPRLIDRARVLVERFAEGLVLGLTA